MEPKIGLVTSGTINPSRQERHVTTLYQACQKFESVFISYLLKSMRKTVPETDYLNNGGIQKGIYMSMMDEEIARVVAEGPGIGLAAALYRQLSQSEKA